MLTPNNNWWNRKQNPRNQPSRRRIRNPKLRRGIFLLPSLFTGGNLLCGYYACVATLWVRCCKPTLSITRESDRSGDRFDSLDGVWAFDRDDTEFGVQFDS